MIANAPFRWQLYEFGLVHDPKGAVVFRPQPVGDVAYGRLYESPKTGEDPGLTAARYA